MVGVEEEVEVDGAVGVFGVVGVSAEAGLDFAEAVVEGFGVEGDLEGEDGVEEVGCVGWHVDGGGLVEGGEADHADAGGADDVVDGLDDVGLAVAEVGAEGDVGGEEKH